MVCGSTRVFEQSVFLFLQFVVPNGTSHSILFNESSCNIDKYFYDRSSLHIFYLRDDLWQIRVQFLSSIGNLKAYWIHYIFFYVFIVLNNLFFDPSECISALSHTRLTSFSLFFFFCANKRCFCNITDLLERPYINASIEMEFILKEIPNLQRGFTFF